MKEGYLGKIPQLQLAGEVAVHNMKIGQSPASCSQPPFSLIAESSYLNFFTCFSLFTVSFLSYTCFYSVSSCALHDLESSVFFAFNL